MAEEIKTNKYWNDNIPFVCIITPTFNRRTELQRCIESVQRQTYRDFEYIIVNDGSTENIDDVVDSFMDQVTFPVMYIKKKNGGVHTARNMGIKCARAEMIFMIDDDDEILDNGLELLVNAWNRVPDKENYFALTGRYIDANGDLVTSGDVAWFFRSSILKENLWPEADGITFVTEWVVIGKLRREYRCYSTSLISSMYHTETEISISKNWGGDSLCRP